MSFAFLLRQAAVPVLMVGMPLTAQAPRREEQVASPLPVHSAVPSDTEVPGVINFARVSDALWRGAQPTAVGFRNLEKQGARTVISFRHDHDDFKLLKGTGLKYLRFPSFSFIPAEENIAKFLRVVQDKANWPVFIHCAQGRDRTGYNVAAYRIMVHGWTPEQAIEEMHAFQFNKVWVFNPAFVKSLKADDLKARVDKEPQPVFMAWVK